MSDLTFVQGDDAPSVTGTLTDSAGAAINLTTVQGVRFQMRLVGDFRYAVDAAATVVTPASGIVRYDWVAGDLDTPGDYIARWEITFLDDSVQHTEPENTITVDPA